MDITSKNKKQFTACMRFVCVIVYSLIFEASANVLAVCANFDFLTPVQVQLVKYGLENFT